MERFIGKIMRYAFIIALVFALVPFSACKKGSTLNRADYLYVKDKASPTASEKKHAPGIVANKSVKLGRGLGVLVTVGYKTLHPSGPDHWITTIKLYSNGKQVAIKEFETGGKKPYAMFQIKLDKGSTLEAVANCNLHGTWIGEPVKVEVR